MEVTNQALERKKRFLAIKEKAGGIHAVRRDVMNRPWRVYFDHTGTILAFTQDETAADGREDWLTFDFTQEQLGILKDKNTAQYVIVQDPKEAGIFSIEARKVEDYVVNADNTFLYQLQTDVAGAELVCVLRGEHLTFALSKDIVSKYKGIDPSQARVENKSTLYFYLTSPNDPHILFHEIVLEFAKLLTNSSVTVALDDDYTGCSLYTKKAFKTYNLVID